MTLACRTLDPDTWFEGTPGYDEYTALHACYRCPLITPCLRVAMAAEHTAAASGRHGIFGGLLPAQRAQLAAADARNYPARAIA